MTKKTYIIGSSAESNIILVLTGDPATSTYSYEKRSIDLRHEKKFLAEDVEFSDGIDDIHWVKISAENFYKIADGDNMIFLKPDSK